MKTVLTCKQKSKLGLPAQKAERETKRETVRLRGKKKKKNSAASVCTGIPLSQDIW